MPRVKVNDIEMYYEIHGEGPKLFFISGSWADLRRNPTIFDRPLAEHFKVLAFDQRGLGQSSKPDKPYTIADYADDAAGLIKALDWGISDVMGASFGGMVAQEFVLRYPDYVKKLVLCCTSSGGKGGSSYPIHTLGDLSYEEAARLWYSVIDNRVDEAWQQVNREEYDEIIKNFTVRLRDLFGEVGSMKRVGVMRQLEARIGHDTFDRLPLLDVPTLICGGLYDGHAPVSNLWALHERIPNSKLEFYEGGHLFLSQDSRAYESIIDFLKNKRY